MTHIAAEPCIDVQCLDCIAVCPVDAIYEVRRMVVIDPEICFDCGACRSECAVGAIHLDRHLPAEWDAFAEINAACAAGTAHVDGLVDDYCSTHQLPVIAGWRNGGAGR